MPKLLSSRTPVVPAEKLTPARYKYLSLGQAQPSLGVPKYDGSVLLGNVDGTTNWVRTSSIVSNTQPTANVIFVAKNGNDSNLGSTMSTPKQTINSALIAATSGTTIYVFSGQYKEVNPLSIPDNVTIIAQETNVSVIPYSKELDVFYLNDNSAIHGITVKNHMYPSIAFSMDPNVVGGVVITNPPLIKNCSSITGPFLKDGTLFVPNETIQETGLPPLNVPRLDSEVVTNTQKQVNRTGAGAGIVIDGGFISSLSYVRAVNIDSFTAINQGGVGVLATDEVILEVIASKTRYCSESFTALNGAIMSLDSCTTEYGDSGLRSDGYHMPAYIAAAGVFEDKFSSLKSIDLNIQNGNILGGIGYLSPVTVNIGTAWVVGLTNIVNYSQIRHLNNLYYITNVVANSVTTVGNAPVHTYGAVIRDGITYYYTGAAATASATVVGGTITAVHVDGVGSGYTSIPSISFTGSGGTGSGAAATATLKLVTDVIVQNISFQPKVATLVKTSSQGGVYYSYVKASSAQVFQITNEFKTDTGQQIQVQPGTNTLIAFTQGTPSAVGATGASTITLYPGIPYILGSATVDVFYSSKITSVNHYFNSVGAGVTHNAHTLTSGIPSYVNIIENNYGKVYYSGLDDRGVFKFDDVLSMNLMTKEPLQLIDGYLSIYGGTVSGTTTINDLRFSGNQILSTNTDQDLVLVPNGNGLIDATNHRITNVQNPIGNSDVATKSWVNGIITGATPYTIDGNVGNFLISGDTITSTVDGADINLAVTGSGKIHIKSTINSISTTSGALVIDGGLGVIKNVTVGGSISAPTFVGNSFSGVAANATTVLGSSQPNITSLGTLTELNVGQLRISDRSVYVSNGNLIFGSTSGNVLPLNNNISNFGSSTTRWATGYFQNIEGLLYTSSQPNISALNYSVTMYDPAKTNVSKLDIGYTSTDAIRISTEVANSKLSVAKFSTFSTATGSGSMQFLPNNALSLTVAQNGVVTIGSTTNSNLIVKGASSTGTATISTNVINGSVSLFETVTGNITLGGTRIEGTGDGVVKLGVSPYQAALSNEVVTAAWVFGNRPFVSFTKSIKGLTKQSVDSVIDSGIGRAFTWDRYRTAKYIINATQIRDDMSRMQHSELLVSHDAPFTLVDGVTASGTTIQLAYSNQNVNLGGLYVGMTLAKYNDTAVGSITSGTTTITAISETTTTVNDGGLIIGKKYKIISRGSGITQSDWTLAGAPNNTVGTMFIATASGNSTKAGTVSAYGYTITVNNAVALSSPITLKAYMADSFKGTMLSVGNTPIIPYNKITYISGAIYPGMMLIINGISHAVVSVTPAGITLDKVPPTNPSGFITGNPNIYITEYAAVETDGQAVTYTAEPTDVIQAGIQLMGTANDNVIGSGLIYKTIYSIEKELYPLG